ncbi:MAG TPA: hypothetical protein VGJ84_01265, partial [Polyangiaceae bacterium]
PAGTSPALGSSPDAAGRTSSSQMRLIGRERSPEETTLSTTRETALTAGLIEQRRFLASAVERVTASLDPGALDGELDSRVFARVEQLVNQLDLPKLPEDLELAKVRDYVKTELLGHGPLGALLVDKSMLAVTISSYDQIFVTRRSGDRQLVAHGFSSDSALRRAVSRLCREAGRPLERGEEKVERRLTDGTRLSALLGPPGFTSSMLTLRRPRVRGSSLEDLVRKGTVSAGLSKLLSYCLRGRVNLLLVGGPGADLFGIASALCAACDDASLMVVEEYEDLVPAELPRAIRVNAAQLGPQGAPFLTHACKIQGARLIIDMANSGLVLSAFETISAGVDGVVATLSAASLSHGMWRLTAALAAGRPGLSVPAARAWITGSFELVLELVRLSDGRQRVQRALELVGVGEDDFLLQDIFTFVSPPGSDKGEFVAAGTVPRVVERLMAHGYPFDTSMFKQ